MNNTLVTIVSGSVSASSSIAYILMKRLEIPLSRVVLFFLKEEVAKRNVHVVQRHINIIGSKCGLANIEMKTFGIDQTCALTQFSETVRQILHTEKQQGNNVYIDATCGRKYISNLLVKIGLEFGPPVVDILYCYLRNRQYKDMPCARIPVTYCKVFSILREKNVVSL